MIKRVFISFAAVLFLAVGNIVAEDLLTRKEKDIVSISQYTAVGDMQNLRKTVDKSLGDGLTVNEIKEIMVQLYAYCGFPRSLNALEVLLQSTKDGSYIEGKKGKALSKKEDKNKVGTKIQTELTGKKVEGEIFEFAPAIDDYLKEHLFGDIFSRGILSYKEREIATIAALASIDGLQSQLNAHIQIGKNVGLTDGQITQILVMTSKPNTEIFPIGEKNDAYAQYFVGQSYLNMLTNEPVHTANVTFEPKCRNNWHIHHNSGQILLVTGGRGYYQEEGKPARELKKGDVVNIPAETKHWHGAAKDSWFSHIAIEVPSENGSTEWLEEVSDDEYEKLQ